MGGVGGVWCVVCVCAEDGQEQYGVDTLVQMGELVCVGGESGVSVGWGVYVGNV